MVDLTYTALLKQMKFFRVDPVSASKEQRIVHRLSQMTFQ